MAFYCSKICLSVTQEGGNAWIFLFDIFITIYWNKEAFIIITMWAKEFIIAEDFDFAFFLFN